jgi:hypothetical protein
MVMGSGLARVAGLESDVYVREVAVSGQTHLVRFPAEYTAQFDVIAQALGMIAPRYEWLWNRAPDAQPANRTMAFRVLVEVGVSEGMGAEQSEVALETLDPPVPSWPDPWAGATEGAPVTVCHVTLAAWNALYANAQTLRFELALDVARCYLELYAADAAADQGEWLADGLAYWQAVQAIDPPDNVLAQLRKDYEAGYSSNLLNTSGEAMYFWEYVFGSSSGVSEPGFPASPDGLNALPDLTALFTPDLFFDYAQVVARNGLAWQPGPDTLADDNSLVTLPQDVDLDLEINSIVLTGIDLPELDPLQPGQGVKIEPRNLAVNGVRAALVVGGGFIELADGSPIELCAEEADGSLFIAAGRGPSPTLVEAPTLSLSRIQECKKEETTLPACIVGTWNMTVSPALGLSQSGLYQFTAHPDGSLSWVADDLAMGPATFDMQMTGHMAAEPVAGSPGRYRVTAFAQQLAEGSRLIVTVNGQEMDLTETARQSFDSLGEMVVYPTFFTCQTQAAGNPLVNFLVEDTDAMGDVALILTRAP